MKLSEIFIKIAADIKLSNDEILFISSFFDRFQLSQQYLIGLQNGTSDLIVDNANANDVAFFRIKDGDTDKNESTIEYEIPSNTQHVIYIGNNRTNRLSSPVDSVKFRCNKDFSVDFNYQYENYAFTAQASGQNVLSHIVTDLASTDAGTASAGSCGVTFMINSNGEAYKSFITLTICGSSTFANDFPMTTVFAQRLSANNIRTITLTPLIGPDFTSNNNISLYGVL